MKKIPGVWGCMVSAVEVVGGALSAISKCNILDSITFHMIHFRSAPGLSVIKTISRPII